MNFLKKKKKQKEEEPINHQKPIVAILDMDELPDEALEITYNHLQKRYSENQNSEIQQKLVLLSQVMTERAVDGGNGHVKEFFMNKGVITEQKWSLLSNEEKQSMAVMKDKMEKLDEALDELTKPQAEKIEISLETKSDHLPSKEEIESVHNQAEELRKAEIEKQVKERVEFEVQEEMKRKEIVLLDNVEVKDPLTIQTKPNLCENKDCKKYGMWHPNENCEEKPKKKGFGSLFKKKIPKMIEVPTQLVPDITKDQKVPPSLSTQLVPNQITQDQKERAKIMEHATKSKFSFLNKPKKEKINLPDIICPDCSHSIKTHQKKGVSTGCKCGCLQTIETIAEKHGVQLFSPKEVLNNVLEQEGITSHEKVEENIQAQKLETMVIQNKTQNVKEVPKPNVVTKPKTLCVNCDHVARTHFEENGFCTVVGCTCEQYRAYPQ